MLFNAECIMLNVEYIVSILPVFHQTLRFYNSLIFMIAPLFSTMHSALCIILLHSTIAAQTLHYTITPDFQSTERIFLRVQLRFEHSDTTRFRLPGHVARSRSRWRCLRNFSTVSGANAGHDSVLVTVPNSHLSTFDTLHYQVYPSDTVSEVTRATTHCPVLQPDFFYVPGECLFLVPEHYTSFDVSVEWRLPSGWHLQSNLDTGAVQRITAATARWRNGMWAAGDFRFYADTVLGQRVHLAIRGRWDFDDQQIFDDICKTVATQREQWRDRATPYYAVTMAPLAAAKTADENGTTLREMAGFGQYQSFVALVGAECTQLRLQRLFNHEMMHEWIGGKILDSRKSGGMDWFSEGFTDYYALRNRWKAGFLDEETFFWEWNERFMELHYTDPFGELTAAQQRKRRYQDDRIFKMIYRRGAILAFWLDCTIRQRSGNAETLQHFMFDLLGYCQETGHYLDEHFDVFTEKLRGYLGEDPAPFFQKYLVEGKRIAPEDFRLPDFLTLNLTAEGVPVFGLKGNNKDAKTLFLR